MKKLILVLFLIFLTSSVSAQFAVPPSEPLNLTTEPLNAEEVIEAAHENAQTGYNLGDALESLGVSVEKEPEHLPGARILREGASDVDRLKKETMGKPFIITYYIQKIATALTGLAAAIAVLFIVQNSFNILTSAGGAEEITKSKKDSWSIIGLLLIMGSYIVVKTIISLPYSGGPGLLEEMEATKNQPLQKMQPLTAPTNVNTPTIIQ